MSIGVKPRLRTDREGRVRFSGFYILGPFGKGETSGIRSAERCGQDHGIGVAGVGDGERPGCRLFIAIDHRSEFRSGDAKRIGERLKIRCQLPVPDNYETVIRVCAYDLTVFCPVHKSVSFGRPGADGDLVAFHIGGTAVHRAAFPRFGADRDIPDDQLKVGCKAAGSGSGEVVGIVRTDDVPPFRPIHKGIMLRGPGRKGDILARVIIPAAFSAAAALWINADQDITGKFYLKG